VGRLVEIGTRIGVPVRIGQVRLIPEARVLIIRWPGGGWVWRRPGRVLVQEGEALTAMPVRDMTRLIQVMLAVAALCLGVLATRLHRGPNGVR
jgi:hypothetical protein